MVVERRRVRGQKVVTTYGDQGNGSAPAGNGPLDAASNEGKEGQGAKCPEYPSHTPQQPSNSPSIHPPVHESPPMYLLSYSAAQSSKGHNNLSHQVTSQPRKRIPH
ncbi:hypothetical protein Ancab_013560 [Ancistrocladus abbreviatus]